MISYSHTNHDCQTSLCLWTELQIKPIFKVKQIEDFEYSHPKLNPVVGLYVQQIFNFLYFMIPIFYLSWSIFLHFNCIWYLLVASGGPSYFQYDLVLFSTFLGMFLPATYIDSKMYYIAQNVTFSMCNEFNISAYKSISIFTHARKIWTGK